MLADPPALLPDGLSISVRFTVDLALIAVRGVLGELGAPGFGAFLDVVTCIPGTRVVLDLTGVSLIDGAALRELARSISGLREGGADLGVVSPLPAVHRLVALTLSTEAAQVEAPAVRWEPPGITASGSSTGAALSLS